ncbi:SMI1/KNR4 family protein [Tritonibacter sp. SIMBA_163]|uniref:SMI1/KNR4 family protein n=1 Tax=Tritonibacter sp. SIMBA_163 TaxID=3080868 RepID=UPI00397FA6D5
MEITLNMALSRFKKDPDYAPATLFWNKAHFEKLLEKTGCRLPTQYKELLETAGEFEHGFGYYFLATWPDGAQTKHELQVPFQPLQSVIDNFEIFRKGREFPDRFPHDMVFIGTADAGHTNLLANGTDPTDNAVYLWETASDPWGTGNNTQGLARCADTLFGFLYNLDDWDNL